MTDSYCKNDSAAQRASAPEVCCFDFQTGKLLHIFDSFLSAAEYLQSVLVFTKPVTAKTIAGRLHAVCRVQHGHAYGFI